MRIITDGEFNGKTALVRADYNVPIDENGTVTDNTRIAATLPTLKYLLDSGAKLVLCSHLGRPDGKYADKYSLAPVASELEKLISEKVIFADDPLVTGEKAKSALEVLKSSDARILLLENTRFRSDEESCSESFSEELAGFGDVFVMDAFGCAHRAHSSTYGAASYLSAYSGFLMANEVKYLSELLEAPEKPFCVVLGGSKVSDKIGVITNLLKKADIILIGGAMAFTFLSALGMKTGRSLVEEDKKDLALQILSDAQKSSVRIILPSDVRAGRSLEDTDAFICDAGNIPDDLMGLDIGPETEKIFTQFIAESRTVIFNGPMGVFENSGFESGTKTVVKAMYDSDAITIVGGGDSAAAVSKFGMTDKMTHISTGGGASLELLEGKILPGVKICSGETK